MYTATMLGSVQHQGVSGAVAKLWLDDYIEDHAADIAEDEGNGNSLNVLIPPHAEGCATQLDLEYHWSVANQAAYEAIFDEVRASIYFGTAAPFAEAACDSTFQ